MKGRILDILRTARGRVSGESMRIELGVSRVTVWKHIQALKEMGYGIEAFSDGYRLEKEPDLPYPWEFPGREDRIHFFTELPSTMDEARRLARNGCPHGTVVIAASQTKGRGRLQRQWHSADGGLYFTLVLRPNVAPAVSPRVNFAASLALAGTLREDFGIDARVKWPNDILVGEKKISGMLSEMEADSDRVRYVNIGIGLNVNNRADRIEPAAVSMRRLLGRNVPRKQVLRRFLDRFDAIFEDAHLEGVIERWKTVTLTIGRRVCIQTQTGERSGLAVDVDSTGALVIRKEDGSTETVFYGDCFLLPD